MGGAKDKTGGQDRLCYRQHGALKSEPLKGAFMLELRLLLDQRQQERTSRLGLDLGDPMVQRHGSVRSNQGFAEVPILGGRWPVAHMAAWVRLAAPILRRIALT